MSSPASGSLRGLRVAVVAVAGTLLAAVARLAARGHLPSVESVMLSSVVPALGGLWLSRRRRGWLSIAAVLGGIQVVLHTWMMSATATGSCLIRGGGRAMHTMATVSCAEGSGQDPVLTSQTLGTGTGTRTRTGTGSLAGSLHGGHPAQDSLTMLLAHALAVAATALVLAAGERALWQLLQWLRPALQILRAALAVVPLSRPRPVLVEIRPAVLRSSADLSGSGRRGPPARLIRPETSSC
jgi:hypothetical protein